MPSKLTEEEKAAIAAFPAERIYRAARGESGIPIEGYGMKERMRVAATQAKRNARFTKNRELDDTIRSLWNKGLTGPEISEKVKLTPNAIRMRLYRMGAERKRF